MPPEGASPAKRSTAVPDVLPADQPEGGTRIGISWNLPSTCCTNSTVHIKIPTQGQAPQISRSEGEKGPP